jgi:hypothetical protein
MKDNRHQRLSPSEKFGGSEGESGGPRGEAAKTRHRLLRTKLVPEAWFMANDPVLMPEEVLILLGAIEQFNSGAFRAEPAQFFRKLEEAEADNPTRLNLLKQTMKAYRGTSR